MSDDFSENVLNYIFKISSGERRIGNVISSLEMYAKAGDIENLSYFINELLDYSDAKKINYYSYAENLLKKTYKKTIENKLEEFNELVKDHFLFDKNFSRASQLIFEMVNYLRGCNNEDREKLKEKVEWAKKTYGHISSGLR